MTDPSNPKRSSRDLLLTLALTFSVVACGDPFRREVTPGLPPAHLAAVHDEVNTLKNLDPKALTKVGPFGWTPLHVAAIYGAPDVARFLIKRKARVNATDQSGMTPLHWAALNGHVEVVDILLKAHAEVMARDALDRTPLHEARTVPVAKLLLDEGAKLETRDADGMTPLHTAQTRKVAQFLIAKGASTSAQANDGRTPLSMPPTAKPRVR